jgi:hypothetical protein
MLGKAAYLGVTVAVTELAAYSGVTVAATELASAIKLFSDLVVWL